jgi:hypothetical protein
MLVWGEQLIRGRWHHCPSKKGAGKAGRFKVFQHVIPPQGTRSDTTKAKQARLCRDGNTPKYYQSNIPIKDHGVGTSEHYHN